jgi:hypothetical protein
MVLTPVLDRQSWRSAGMTTRYTRPPLVLFVLLATGCAIGPEEPLPPVGRPALFEPPAACVAAPPLPPFPNPVSRPSDPLECLPVSWGDRELPIELTIVDGRVRAIRFYEPCSGRVIPVEASIRGCIESSLSTWSYSVEPPCPGHESVSTSYLFLQRLVGRPKPVDVDAAPCAPSRPGVGE